MSYKLGLYSFIRVFEEKFPEPEYTWERGFKHHSSSGDIIQRDNLEHIKVYYNAKLVFTIDARFDYGLSLIFASPYMNGQRKQWARHHRPLKPWLFGNQNHKRMWLRRKKPKFRQVANKFCCQVLNNLSTFNER